MGIGRPLALVRVSIHCLILTHNGLTTETDRGFQFIRCTDVTDNFVLDTNAAAFELRGDNDTFEVQIGHGFKPDRLPDASGAGVENRGRVFLPILLAAWL